MDQFETEFYNIYFKIKSLTQEINKLWNIRVQEDDPAVRLHQTDLYNQKVFELNELRKIFSCNQKY